MQGTQAKYIFSLFLIIFLFVYCNCSWAEYAINMTQGVTPISRSIYKLHMIIFWICVVIGVTVFSVMFYAIIFHRKSRGYNAANFHESITVEIIWTIIPFLILGAMAFPAIKVLLEMENTDDSDLTIKITGYMWRWGYEYLDQDVKFLSSITTPHLQIKNLDIKDKNYLLEVDNPLIVPINKKIRFLMTANDVIHSWWVPAFGVKKDAVPGFINETWTIIEKPGTYRGQCAELCGTNHGFMPIVVIAKTEAEYNTWLQSQKKTEPPKIS